MTARKPPDRRQNRGTRDIGLVKETGAAPPMPRGLCRAAQEAWNGYWSDYVSGASTPSDIALIRRWIKDLDRYERLVAQADQRPIVKGSKGQEVGNPLYQLAMKLQAGIMEAERQLGIGPLNRLKIGLIVSESYKTLSELNAEADTGDDNDDIRLQLVTDLGKNAD
ncbi:hypothetical protein [Mycobacterium avium]|uniref:hypothetical protein n=1 Tax=Mycobacterium avium TaxID=1764 RepID=UPI002666C4B8|nr:hypothetical protein [Mycobacterium avium]MDO2354665.1 hypothetical protein [Mycobacterium avium subsp. hominissuis]